MVCTDRIVCVAVEVRKRTLYRKLILRKWRLKFSNDFDVILVVILDNHCTLVRLSMGILFVFVSCAYDAASNSNSGD